MLLENRKAFEPSDYLGLRTRVPPLPFESTPLTLTNGRRQFPT